MLYIKEVIKHQLITKDLTSSSWASHVKKLLQKYSLPTAFSLLQHPPKREAWKKSVKQAVHSYWTQDLREAASEMSSLIYLNIYECSTSTMHPVYLNVHSPLDVLKATVQAKVLTKRYPTAASSCSGTRSKCCPLCGTENETIEHFLLVCPSLINVRMPYMLKMMNYFRVTQTSIDPWKILLTITDPSNISSNYKEYQLCSRNLIFKLHTARSVKTGGRSEYRTVGACPN